MKRLFYIILRVVNWAFVLIALLAAINLASIIGNYNEFGFPMPAAIPGLFVIAYAIYVLAMIPLWFYSTNDISRLQKIVGIILAVIEICIVVYDTCIRCFQSEYTIYFLLVPLIVNIIGLLIMRAFQIFLVYLHSN